MKAAIWWRVSTDSQKDISPDTQIADALALAEQGGFEVPEDYIVGTVWHSLSVYDSPAMENLKELIRSKAIDAVFMYDADRLPAKPAHRLLFRALCEDYGVKVRCRYGEVPEGEMAEVMEFLSSWSKEKQVEKAQQGAADGLRGRAKLKGLPVNAKTPYGYRFEYVINDGKRMPVAYEPDPATYPVAVRIWREVLAGQSMHRVCRNLIADGIPTARGGTWAPATIFGILKNPIYGGRAYALRHFVQVPKRRRAERSQKREKTSVGRRDLGDATLLDFPVIDPVVTWSEWETIEQRLKNNKKNSPRNAKRLYLLSGMVFCDRDGRRLAVNGATETRHYYGCTLRPGQARFGEPCDNKHINGPKLEAAVWDTVVNFLTDPSVFLAEMDRRRGSTDGEADHVREAIKTLERKLAKLNSMDVELVSMKVRGSIIPEVFERSLALNKAERVYYEEELDRLAAELTTADQQNAAIEALKQVRDRIADKLATTTAEERQWVLKTLQTRVTVSPEAITVSVGVPPQLVDYVNNTRLLR